MNDENDIPAEDVEKVRVEDEMEQSYIDYAMSVIIGRALPDVRDGLKPVQRRILYSMYKEGITSGSGHRKSSSIIGDTMGNYHPHGDKAIYDALVRMSQDFSLRAPLVDGQGNFGSMDGDSAAAMRYTEARLSKFGELLLQDLNEDTVEWSSNYDDRMEEPDVLPSAFPNLLVNGSSGIAVGMSTEIPPHNIGEVIDATIELIENPQCDIEALMEHVKGPDFPTGGEIVINEGIENAYKEGKGRIKVRASYEVTEERIVINEIPYQKRKKKSSIIKRIADMVENDDLDGVRDLRDESNRDGVRIVIELKRDAMPEVVENKLIDKKVLENNFSMINLALVDDQPRVLTLKETLQEYIKHRKNVITKRIQRNLEEDEEREHILEGRLVALDNVDEVVETIRGEENRKKAIEQLTNNFELTKTQAEHIVRMQLGSLTSMEKEEVKEEHREVQSRIEDYKETLQSEEKLRELIKNELREVKEEYDQERKTNLIHDTSSVNYEDLIPEEDMLITITNKGYIKRTNIDKFRIQSRGGKGIKSMKTNNGDSVTQVLTCTTHDRLLAFTNEGNVYSFKCHELPESGRNSKGRPITNILNLDNDENIVEISNIKERDYLLIATSNGLVKKTSLDKYDDIYNGGIRGIKLNSDDSIADITTTSEEDNLMLTTKKGKAIRFNEDSIRSVSRASKGVKGIDVAEDDEVVSINNSNKKYLLSITENGYGKRTEVEEYSLQSRGGKGKIDIKTDERNGDVVSSYVVGDNDNIILCSVSGNVIRINVEEISTAGRNTKGVTLMNCDGISSVSMEN
jgi:DNA gyrase subunit A